MMPAVEVAPYNPMWPMLFQAESARLSAALKDVCITVHHIGSTSVPGLCAKPKLDIILVIGNVNIARSRLEQLGYIYGGELNIPFQHYFKLRGAPVEINLHVYEPDHPEIELNLMFRDYLRKHPQDRDAYGVLKQNLAGQATAHHKGNGQFKAYTLGKDSFIKSILDKCEFNRLCLRFCMHHDEWSTYRELLDPNHDTILKDPNHLHFVLYKGTRIIGCAHVEYLSGNVAAFKGIAFVPTYQFPDFQDELRQRITTWLTQRGVAHII